LHIESSIQPDTHFWQRSVSTQTTTWLADHKVQDMIVMPAAGYIDMTMSVIRDLRETGPCVLEDLKFKRPLVIPGDAAALVQLVLSSGTSRYLYAKASRAVLREWRNSSHRRRHPSGAFFHRRDPQQVRCRDHR
jgi:acyl transferase domain-containing protein